MRLPDFKKFAYHPVVKLGHDYQVLDFTVGPVAARTDATYSVGRYNEDRKNMYTAPLFEGQRTVHMGIDLGGPVGTPVHAFFDGTVHDLANHQADGDYGPTLITRHQLGDTILYALHGHLSAQSLDDKKHGQVVKRGECLGWLGSEEENGGWPPHVHFQLSLVAPENCDYPGVVAPKDVDDALMRYPDPRWVLGPLYPPELKSE